MADALSGCGTGVTAPPGNSETAMTSWMPIIETGHTAVMIPAAGAILAWLIVGRTWKLALWWSLIFGVGLGVVACSKMAFLGWGLEMPAIGFQALSGHAWRATAVVPVLFFVVAQQLPLAWRLRAALCGALVGLALGVLLVAFAFHTASEVIASTVLGFAAAFVFIRLAMAAPPSRTTPWAVPATLLVVAAVCSLKPAALNHRLVDLALHVSGRDQPYRWARQVDPPPHSAAGRRNQDACPVRGLR